MTARPLHHARANAVLEQRCEVRTMEPTILTTSGLALRPRAGAEVEFCEPIETASLVALEVIVDGRRVRWAELRGAGRMGRARRLLKAAQSRYLDDGATLDARALLMELA